LFTVFNTYLCCSLWSVGHNWDSGLDDKNLNVSTFRNGDSIMFAKTDEEWIKADKNKVPAWCYYDNKAENGAKFGKLYNWHAVSDSRGLAPKGWHIPSNEEFSKLNETLGGTSAAGKKIKSKQGWKENGNGSDESGLNAYPAGYRYSNVGFVGISSDAYFWSTTEKNTSNAFYYVLSFDGDNFFRLNALKGRGKSIRCIKD